MRSHYSCSNQAHGLCQRLPLRYRPSQDRAVHAPQGHYHIADDSETVRHKWLPTVYNPLVPQEQELY